MNRNSRFLLEKCQCLLYANNVTEMFYVILVKWSS